MTLQEAVKAYIYQVKNQSPIVSTSHAHYMAYAKRFGDDVWQKALDDYFSKQKTRVVTQAQLNQEKRG
jgi:hypothetical protein